MPAHDRGACYSSIRDQSTFGARDTPRPDKPRGGGGPPAPPPSPSNRGSYYQGSSVDQDSYFVKPFGLTSVPSLQRTMDASAGHSPSSVQGPPQGLQGLPTNGPPTANNPPTTAPPTTQGGNETTQGDNGTTGTSNE